MARCGCGGGCQCAFTGSSSLTVTGNGTPANPWVGTAHVDCSEARGCFSAGNGLAYDSTTGIFSALVSPAAGNQLTVSGSGLFVAPGSATVTTGPGVLGNGSPANAVRANVSAWNFPGNVDAGGSLIYTDTAGKLRGEPPYHTYYFQLRRTNTFAIGALPVAAGTPISNVDVPLDLVVVNPDPYRPMRVMWKQEHRIYVSLPANSSATTGMNTEETWSGGNNGATALARNGVYTDKLNEFTANLAPGGSVTLSMQAQAGRGTGGASVIEIHMSHRVWLMPIS